MRTQIARTCCSCQPLRPSHRSYRLSDTSGLVVTRIRSSGEIMPPTDNAVHTSGFFLLSACNLQQNCCQALPRMLSAYPCVGPQQGLQLRFGIVSDVQYADIKDGHSFLGTPRYYRASLDGLRRAVLGWKTQQVEFGIQFGDIIDGFNPKDKSETALQSVLDEFALLHKPVYHMIGNHCLYNLPRNRLNEALGIHGTSSYYSFSPHQAWRFVVIDAYDVSMLGWPESHPLHQQAKAILDEKNINEVTALHAAHDHTHASGLLACVPVLPVTQMH